MRVGLFTTCVADTMFPAAAEATRTILERLGIEVAVPAEQTCCGQLHLNAGYRSQAVPLAKAFVRQFSEFDAVVSPSSSCVGMIRELYGQVLGIDDAVTARTWELSEFLVRHLEVEDLGARYPHRVTYHPTCHSLRVTRIGDAPLRLLRNVRELELIELPQATECCGFGGTFSIKNADTSSAMLTDKLERIAATGAEVCTAVDGSCLLQIGGGLSRRGDRAQAVHLAEILASR